MVKAQLQSQKKAFEEIANSEIGFRQQKISSRKLCSEKIVLISVQFIIGDGFGFIIKFLFLDFENYGLTSESDLSSKDADNNQFYGYYTFSMTSVHG